MSIGFLVEASEAMFLSGDDLIAKAEEERRSPGVFDIRLKCSKNDPQADRINISNGFVRFETTIASLLHVIKSLTVDFLMRAKGEQSLPAFAAWNIWKPYEFSQDSGLTSNQYGFLADRSSMKGG